MSHEFLDDISTQEMLDSFEEVKNENASRSPCVGNISYDCVQNGLRGLEAFAEDTGLDYAVVGGIGTQLRALADSRNLMSLMKYFGNRKTNDIDIIVRNRTDALTYLQHSNYYEREDCPDLDILDENLIPGQEEMIQDAETLDFREVVDEQYSEQFDFTVCIPTTEDLVYSKAWDPRLKGRTGTNYDLRIHVQADGYLFDMDETKVFNKIQERAPNPGSSYRFLEHYGL